ncbi:cilia- and flagella-associated protein 263 [Temnothorax nylanderi]|uniref:cilia- and flagella-associated protein 263 n=1 Tax=Temnothorax nylanderi TaxID=102681 RepID=UPI003A89741C
MSRQQSSAFSIGSLVLTPKQDDFCYYEDMTETELRQALEDIVYSNLFLRLENDIFERYLARRDPESLQTIAQILETAKRVQKIAPQHSRTSPVISVTGSLVNVRDRDSVSIASVRSGSRHVTPSLLTARAPTGGTKFVEERLKVVDIMVEQIRLKMTTIKCQIRKVKLQLKQRKELGEALRAIDFEQLNIENKVCIRKIDEKTQYLLEMKRIVGHYSIALSKHKEKVEGLMLIMNEMKNKIVSKRQEIINLQSEQIATKIEIEKADKQLKSMMELIKNFEVPSVIDSIKMRMKLQELQRIHKQLSRQREIQRITLKSRKQLQDIS